MKVKQINLRCFEITTESPSEAEAYVRTHEKVLRPYLILFRGAFNARLESAMRAMGQTCAWADNDAVLFAKESVKMPKPPAETVISAKSANAAVINTSTTIPAAKTRVIRRHIRSGENIEHNGDMICFGRINSGAEITVAGCCMLFAPLFGLCRVQGEAAFVQSVGKEGLLMFHDEIFESFDAPKRFFWDNNEVKIEECK